MKKPLSIYTLLFFLLCLVRFAVAGNNFSFQRPVGQTSRSASALLDSIITWQWDAATSKFDQYTSETYYGYDSLGNNIFSQTDTGAWMPFSQDSFYYNSRNQPSYDYLQFWMGTDWENAALDYFLYNSQNLQDSLVSVGWTGTAWDTIEGISYTYAADSTVRSSTLWFDFGTWQPFLLDTFTYDLHHNVLTDLELVWSGTAWQNNSLTQYTYNINNKATEVLIEGWTIEGWIPSGKTINSFNANGDVISAIDSDYTDALVDSFHYYYQGAPASVRDISNSVASVSVYPNPAGSAINIAFNDPASTPLTVTLFDITGRALLAQPLSVTPERINLNEFAPGVYQVVISDDKGNKTVKPVVIR